MAIQMRQGNEVDFDAEKMLPGEWAVSTDARIVRMCFAPGVVVRMATYEAFEADMVKIEAILKNVQDIQTAVKLVQAQIDGKSELVAENASMAEEYMLKAKEYAEQAGAFTGMQIAKRDLLGVVKGGDMAVEDDGALRNFKRGAGNTFAVSDTVEAPISDIKMYGKSVQDGVPTPDNPQPIVSVGEKLATGKNLYNNATSTNQGLSDDGTISNNNQRVLSDFIGVSAMTYTLTFHSSICCFIGYGVYDSAKNFLSRVMLDDLSGRVSFTPTQNGYIRLMFRGVDEYNDNVPLSVLSEIMLNSGSTALPWEPYTGGKKAAFDVGIGNEICGKNLLDNISSLEIFDLVGDGSILRYGRSFEGGKTYTVTNQSGELRFIRLPSSDFSDRGSTISIEHNASVNVTVDSNHILWFFCNQYAISTMDNCMVAVGSDVSYSPYTGQSHTLNRTLRAIPVTDPTLANYTDESGQMWCADTIEEVNGKTCLVERVNRANLKDLPISAWYAENNYFANSGIKSSINAGYCTHFKNGKYTDYNGGEYYFGISTTRICISNYGFTSLDEFKAFIAENDVYCGYILATPIVTELTAEEVSAIESLHSYNGVTTVMSDAWAEVECATSNVAAYVMSNKKEIEAVVNELGTSDISAIGDGTVKGAIKEHNDRYQLTTYIDISGLYLGVDNSQITLPMIADAMVNCSYLDCSIWKGSFTSFEFPAGVTANFLRLTVSKTNELSIEATLRDLETNTLYVNSNANGTWSGWNSYLPLTGGTLSGDVTISDANTTIPGMYLGNSVVGEGAGIAYFKNDKSAAVVAQSGDKYTSLYFYPNAPTLAGRLQLVIDNANWYQIFGEHNKPSGSYTGNGSANRSITVGGIGGCLRISTAGNMALVFYYGAIVLDANGGLSALGQDTMYFRDGILTHVKNNYFNTTGYNVEYHLM